MNHFLKGAATAAVVLIVLLGINMLCNMQDIYLDPTMIGTVSAVGAMLIYRGLTRHEK